MSIEASTLTFVSILLAVVVVAVLGIYLVRRGFEADLAQSRARYRLARGIAQELHRFLGDQDRHLHRTVILLTAGDLSKLEDYIETIPKPECGQLRAPHREATLIQAFQDRARKFAEGAQDVLGPEEYGND